MPNALSSTLWTLSPTSPVSISGAYIKQSLHAECDTALQALRGVSLIGVAAHPGKTHPSMDRRETSQHLEKQTGGP
jgi:hypothetical protein